MKTKITLVILFCLIISTPLDLISQEWVKVEGPKPFINSITFSLKDKNKVFVASDQIQLDLSSQELLFVPINGLGYHVSTDGGKTFGEEAMENGKYILDFVNDKFDKDVWYMSYLTGQRSYITKSTDNGETWNDQNISCDGGFVVLQLVQDDVEQNTLYMSAINTGAGFIKTEDGFESCKETETITVAARDLKISKVDNKMMYLAADTKYESGVYISSDKGETWTKNTEGIEKLRIHSVLPSAFYTNIVYAAADTLTNDNEVSGKGIYQSLDAGKTWVRILATESSVYQLSQHPSNPALMIAAAGTEGVYVSCNDGYDWGKMNTGLPDGADVRLATIPDWDAENNKFDALIGVYNEGLYRASSLTGPNCELVSVNPVYANTFSLHKVYPNPVIDNLQITLDVKEFSPYQFSLISIDGKNEIIIDSQMLNAGSHDISIPLDKNIINGAYILRISNETEHINYKIIKDHNKSILTL